MATSCKGLVVNYADEKFARGQVRLRASCETSGQEIACYGPGNVPTIHAEVPYYFKFEALQEASRRCQLLVWLDASIILTGRPLDPIFERARHEGYVLTCPGFNCAQWCNDRSLASFGFTRDEAEKLPAVRGGFFAVDLDHPLGRLLVDETMRHRDDFRGCRHNDDQTESRDPRCRGHRHDQSVMSLVAAQHGLTVLPHDDPPWCYYGGLDPDYLLCVVGPA